MALASATPTGMKLGTGSTAPAKSGAGAAVVTYLTGSNKAFDATFPTAVAGVVTYKRTYAAGEATYAVGDTVTKDGHRWSCLIAHGTERQGTWAPGIAPTIWSDLGPA